MNSHQINNGSLYLMHYEDTDRTTFLHWELKMEVEDFYNLTFVLLCVVITLGTTGNIISVIVWSKGARCRTSVFASYFKILAVCDLFVLLVPGMDSMLNFVPENSTHLRTLNGFLCKFMIFMAYFGVQLSAWVTVAMSVECTTALCFPVLFYHRKDKTRCACLVFVSTALLLTGLNIPISLSADLVTMKWHGKSVQYCNVESQSQTQIITVLKYSSSIGFYVALPVLIFIICDLIIVIKLCEMRYSTSVHRILTRNIKSTAKLIVGINLMHIITDVPVVLTFLVRFDIIEMDAINLRILSVTSYGCLYLSNAINVLLYCMMKTTFRYDFAMLCRRSFVHHSSTVRRANDEEMELEAGALNTVKGLKLDFQNRDDFWV